MNTSRLLTAAVAVSTLGVAWAAELESSTKDDCVDLHFSFLKGADHKIDSLTESDQGYSAKVTGYTYDRAQDKFVSQSFDQYLGAGLGMKSDLFDDHRLDNGNTYEFFLVEFDTPVKDLEFNFKTFGYYDQDVVYGVGNAGADFVLEGKSTTDLANLGFLKYEQSGTPGLGKFSISIDTSRFGNGVNSVLIGPPVDGDSHVDAYKLQTIDGTTCPNPIPEPSSALLGLGALGLAGTRRRR